MRLVVAAFAIVALLAMPVARSQPVPADPLEERIEALDALYLKRDLDAAIPLGEALLPEVRDARGLADASPYFVADRLASAKRDAGRNAEALDLAREWLALAEDHVGPDSRSALRLRMTAATILYELGRVREHVAEAEVVSRRATDPSLLPIRRYADYERVLGYTRLGRLGEAAALGEQALAEDIAAGRHTDEYGFTNMDNLAGVYADLGRHDEAIAMQLRAYELFAARFGRDDHRTLSVLSNVVNVYRQAGRPEEALEAALRIANLRTAASGSVDRNTLVARKTAAHLMIELGRMDEAERLLRALEPLWAQAFGEGDAHALDNRYFLAKIAVARGDLALARQSLAATCPAYGATDDAPDGPAQHCRLLLAEVEWRLGARREALALTDASLTAFERRLADGRLADTSRQSFFATRAPYFRRWVEWLVAAGEREQAFAVAERLRARALLQSIVNRHADESAAVLPGEAIDALAEAKAVLARAEEAVAHAQDADARAIAVAERDRRQRELAALRERLRSEHPRYAVLTDARHVDHRGAAAALPTGTAAVAYLLGPERAIAFVVDKRAPLAVVDLGPAPRIVATAEALRALLAQDGSRVWRSRAGELRVAALPPGAQWQRVTDWRSVAALAGRQLVAPVLRHAGGRRDWIVVPDGVLATLPFEALVVAGRPLVDTRTVRYVQSLSVLAALRERGAARTRTSVLSVGDPDYATADVPGSSPPSSFDALAFVRGMATRGDAARSAYARLGAAWAPLPFTREEVDAVAGAFGEHGLRLTGRDASESRLQALNDERRLRGFRYLHFATHAVLNLEAPALSAVVLAQAPETLTARADGYVTAAEWPAYELDTHLIVLSGCETGRGRVLDGEGVTGLPYALFVAGNRNAVMTLWKVADAPSARFVAQFFRRIAGGATIADALAATKRSFAAARDTAHPVFWAGFVQYGAD